MFKIYCLLLNIVFCFSKLGLIDSIGAPLCTSSPEIFGNYDGDSCIYIDGQFDTTIIAKPGCESGYIKDIEIMSPPGSFQSSLKDFSINPGYKYKNVSFYADSDKKYMICSKAIDTIDRESKPYCFFLYNKKEIPHIKFDSLNPLGSVKSSAYEFQAEFNVNVVKPENPSFIKIYSKESGQMIYSIDSSSFVNSTRFVMNTMYFNLPISNFPSGSYYILLDEGVAISDTRCKTNSLGLSNSSIWTFVVDSSDSDRRYFTGSSCPSPYTLVDNHCYYVSASLADWETAKNYCISINGSLFVAENETDFKWLTSQFGSTILSNIWVGAFTQPNDVYNFDWLDWSDLPVTSSYWCGGEPNNAGGSGTTVGEGCAEMSSSLCLNDNSCSNSLSYVCEYGQVVLKGTTVAPDTTYFAVICPPGFTLLEGHCYSKSQWSAWWEYAEYDCVSMDAHLISINSDAEFNFMKDAVKSVSSDIWVGGRSLNNKVFNFYWTDNSPFPNNSTYWCQGEPNNGGGSASSVSEACTTFTTSDCVNDAPCSGWNYYMCEHNPPEVTTTTTTTPRTAPIIQNNYFQIEKQANTCHSFEMISIFLIIIYSVAVFHFFMIILAIQRLTTIDEIRSIMFQKL